MKGFMPALREQRGTGAKASHFAILTATRSAEICGATWDEIDLDGAVWVIPEARMKAGKEHRVPLSLGAVNLLKGLPRSDETNLVFPSAANKIISDGTMNAVLERMKVDAVQHGLRPLRPCFYRCWQGVTFLGDPAKIGPRVIGVKEMLGDWRLSRDPGEELDAFRARAQQAAPRARTGLAAIVDELAEEVPA